MRRPAPQKRVVFGESYTWQNTRQATCIDTLKELRQVMLGFDLDPTNSARHLEAWSQSCPAWGEDIAQHENEILSIFVDICSLFHREPEVNHRASSEEPSAESYLFSYLRMVETNARRTSSHICNCIAPCTGSLRRLSSWMDLRN